MTAKFQLGRVVATKNLVSTLEAEGGMEYVPIALRLHQSGKWGQLGAEDAETQDDSLDPTSAVQERLMSVWTTPAGTKFWIITEWNRSLTTILLPEDY